MGGGDASGGDGPEQELKRAAAAAYNYEGDARWAEYWSNILVPPHLASRPDVVDHYKRKFYQRYIDRDLVVEPMSSTGSTQPSGPEVRIKFQISCTTAPTATNRQCYKSLTVLVVAGLGMLPILPKHLADRACKLSLLGTILSSAYSLYSTYGKPRAWNMPAVQSWLQAVLGTKDFIHLMFSLMLFTSQLHLKIAALPVFCWALDHVARFLRRNFARSSFYRSYLEEPCLWVETNNTTLSLLSSNAEIALGFLLIISLFSWQRSIIQTFMYWQVLKQMYHAPVTASYHQSAWAKIGRIVNPYIHRYAPFLNTPISAAQRWWFRFININMNVGNV
uniref:Uncharacterized protein n=2 Tax=Oryza glumipatula TaxID=40148 RepID=A0A0E0A3J0_9ORYZ